MRLVKFTVATEDADRTRETLSEEDVEYVVTQTDDDDDTVLFEFPIPPQGVEPIFEALEEADVEREYTVVVSAETVDTATIEDLEERFVHGTEESDSIAHDEIRSRASEMTPGPVTYYAMTVLSAVVAAAGLLLDAPTVVVGSMVIAPQVGAALTSTVGMTVDDRTLIRKGFRAQVAGLLVAVAGVFVIAIALKRTAMVPPALDPTTVEQLGKRTSPGLLAAVIGVAAGAAGAFGLATALPISLVGVMIAAALIPAAAAVGIGLAWSLPAIASGALALLVVNAVGINLSAFAVLWTFGYRPQGWGEWNGVVDLADYWPTLTTVTVLVVALVLVGSVVSTHSAFTDAVNEEVNAVLDRPDYDHLRIVELRVSFTAGGLAGPREVNVVVQNPVDAPPPSLADALADRIAERTDTPITVDVRYTGHQRANSSAAALRSPAAVPAPAARAGD